MSTMASSLMVIASLECSGLFHVFFLAAAPNEFAVADVAVSERSVSDAEDANVSGKRGVLLVSVTVEWLCF